jgi:hypothetical protein
MSDDSEENLDELKARGIIRNQEAGNQLAVVDPSEIAIDPLSSKELDRLVNATVPEAARRPRVGRGVPRNRRNDAARTNIPTTPQPRAGRGVPVNRRVNDRRKIEADILQSQAQREKARLEAAAIESATTAREQDNSRITTATRTATQVGPRILSGPARPNPLNNYANYTYSLSFHVIPIEKYNRLAAEPGYQYINDDQTILIASGGRQDQKVFQRHPEFKEDFYFENLKFTTVVGMNSRSRFSNALEINFTLVEPYGFTLINRLIAVADQLKTKSWMQIPFMIQIDFLGNNDAGELMHPIPDQTKYIPVKLIGCKSKISNRGAEYQLQCVPFNHQAFSESSASTPASFEVTASTIKDFFSSTGPSGEADNILKVKLAGRERQEQLAKEIDEERKKDPKSPRIAELSTQRNSLNKDLLSSSYLIGSYTAALNSYQQQLLTNQHIKQTEEYKFVFDSEFADSKIVFPKKTSATRTPMLTLNTPGGIAAIRAQAGLPTGGLDATRETFAINAGTNVIEVISMALRSSEFIRNQFKDPAVETPDPPEVPTDGQQAADQLGKPITWFKIIPVIKLKEFDLKRNVYAKEITYYVKKYTYYNTKFRDAPKSLPSYSCKEYHYIYTGKNESIINFDIDFDIMFYTAITADRAKIQTTLVQQQPQQDNKDDSKPADSSVRVAERITYPVSGQADQTDPVSADSKSVLVDDFSKSVMSSSRGDMINVKLKIIGDPELIKQDDIYLNPANNPSQLTNQIIDPKTNSIIFDTSEVFSLLTFRTPRDYNTETGLMNYDKLEYSVFSGVYKILTVENEFTRGQFTQTLDLVRLFDQPAWDTLSSVQIKSSDQRSQEITTIPQANQPDPSTETKPEPVIINNTDVAGVDDLIAIQQDEQNSSSVDLQNQNVENFPEINREVLKQLQRLRRDLKNIPETPIQPGEF